MPGVMIGQNVAAGGHDLVGAIQMWANEESAFSYGQNPTGVVGHYTQVSVAVVVELPLPPPPPPSTYAIAAAAGAETTAAPTTTATTTNKQ